MLNVNELRAGVYCSVLHYLNSVRLLAFHAQAPGAAEEASCSRAPGREGGRVGKHVDFRFSTDQILLLLTHAEACLQIRNRGCWAVSSSGGSIMDPDSQSALI